MDTWEEPGSRSLGVTVWKETDDGGTAKVGSWRHQLSTEHLSPITVNMQLGTFKL